MKKIIVLLLVTFLFYSSVYSQELAITEDGRKVFLKADGTYKFLINTEKENREGTIKGVVTYFFNNNYGYKPDIGAEVIIRKTNKNDPTRLILYKFSSAKTYRKIASNNELTGKTDSFTENKLIELGVETGEKYDKLCKDTYQHIINHKITNLDAIKLTVDARGTFETSVEEGLYEIIIISKNRSSANGVEALGDVENKLVEVVSDKTNNVSVEFNLN